MKTQNTKLAKLNRYVHKLCGMYTRIAHRLGVYRSYVSRVARGERSSPEVEDALIQEFEQIQEG